MSDRTDELLHLVRENARDIMDDWVNGGRLVPLKFGPTVRVEERESADDDGGVWGAFRITTVDGRFVIELEATAWYAGEQDCWDWGSESHYTKQFETEDLQKFETTVKVFVDTEGSALDRMVDAEVDSKREELR